MLPILTNKAVVTICLEELLGLILGVEHDPYIYCITNHPVYVLLLVLVLNTASIVTAASRELHTTPVSKKRSASVHFIKQINIISKQTSGDDLFHSAPIPPYYAGLS
jgi:hypothetical protein